MVCFVVSKLCSRSLGIVIVVVGAKRGTAKRGGRVKPLEQLLAYSAAKFQAHE